MPPSAWTESGLTPVYGNRAVAAIVKFRRDTGAPLPRLEVASSGPMEAWRCLKRRTCDVIDGRVVATADASADRSRIWLATRNT